MTRLVALEVGGDPAPWISLGLPFADGRGLISDVEILFVDGAPGIRGWVFSGDSDFSTAIDGIPTRVVASPPSHATVSTFGVSRAVGLDHVVVNTDDSPRTCASVEAVLGIPVRRVRNLPGGATQTFHKADNIVLEVVAGPQVRVEGSSLWGMVASIEDLDALAASLGGDVVSPPKDAVQPGRRIATVRESAGLGVPFALMSPHVRASASD